MKINILMYIDSFIYLLILFFFFLQICLIPTVLLYAMFFLIENASQLFFPCQEIYFYVPC